MRSELVEKLSRLKRDLNAVILAHNYQPPEVQEVADFVGDSLELSLRALDVDARVVVFAGVDFMAEQAKILNPDKVVLHPDRQATCTLALFGDLEIVGYYRKKFEGYPLLAYVNSYAQVKAVADYVVTSSSVVDVVKALDSEKVLLAPDANLAKYASRVTGKEVVGIPPCGHCPVHKAISAEDVLRMRRLYPGAEVVVHPETDPEVQSVADYVGSTSQMIRRVKQSSASVIVLGTDKDIVHRARREAPNKVVLPISENIFCPYMKRITLEKIVEALAERKHVVEVPQELAQKAREAIMRTFDLLGLGAKPWRK